MTIMIGTRLIHPNGRSGGGAGTTDPPGRTLRAKLDPNRLTAGSDEGRSFRWSVSCHSHGSPHLKPPRTSQREPGEPDLGRSGLTIMIGTRLIHPNGHTGGHEDSKPVPCTWVSERMKDGAS